jgi:predicted anti-sigma-YlaC factor YlaD
MTPDDEVLFGHVCDDCRSCFERVERLTIAEASGADLALALAEFELHGASLRCLARWYPDEKRVRLALTEWELSSVQLSSRGFAVDAR